MKRCLLYTAVFLTLCLVVLGGTFALPAEKAFADTTVSWNQLRNAEWVDLNQPSLARKIKQLSWVKDGILRETEQGPAQNLVDTATWYVGLSHALVDSHWVKDGVGEAENEALADFLRIAYVDTPSAIKIARMPFLFDFDPADGHAVDALSALASFLPERFNEVMDHPSVADGIDDDEAKIVSTLYHAFQNNPYLAGQMLLPGAVTLNERVLHLPLSGKTRLSIIRTGPRAQDTMDQFEAAVTFAENYMGLPFPTGQVTLLVADVTTYGIHLGTHIAISPGYETDESGYSIESTLTHESAHYYWWNYVSWINEGAANFMEAQAGDSPGVADSYPCAHARNIAEFEALNPERAHDAWWCMYSFGERIFMDMHRALGDGPFRQGLRNLYLAPETYDEEGVSVYRGIDAFKDAFKGVERAGSNAVDSVINRWYYGTEPYDLSALDTRSANPVLPDGRGRITDAYMSFSADERGDKTNRISASDAEDWLRLFVHYSGMTGRPTAHVVTYFEDGVAFSRNDVSMSHNSGWFSTGVLSPSRDWAAGTYQVYVYHEGQKLAEVEFEVLP